MEEWVQHPYDHTALDDILPCVDPAMTAEVMNQSKNVTYQIINIMNGMIANVSNRDFPPQAVPLYYNQSGPLVPVLCNPYLPDLSPRPCLTEELHFDNAVWKGYICETTSTSGSEICTTIGRLTPTFYYQMTSAVNVTYALYRYGPYLSDLADCTFVRQTFKFISDTSCPGLGQYSNQVYAGLLVVSIAVMLSLIFWVVYARERRHRKYGKVFVRLEKPFYQKN
ncbi:envelope glycoprotein B [Rhynchospora pubera]|uniref:Envelope glycoprotein B n=1 Tax=Rhynchospora pubera TaxID=906938 RepID=A0AAV8H6J6_9POAL|nr:envelope glycoprotein B [Rhynchospora pubera]